VWEVLVINNTELYSYNGKGNTISKLKIIGQQWGNHGSALFLNNAHLTVKNLNIKDLDLLGNGTAAGIITESGTDWKTQWDDTHLVVENVNIYGDNMRIRSSKVGGVAADVNVHKVTMKNVHVYGKNALLGGPTGNSAVGGLAGTMKTDEMEITNCSFSGYLSGKHFQHGAGGLIGELDLSGYVNGPDKTWPSIENCYVAGRNRSIEAPNADLLGDDDQLRELFNISGYDTVGGLVGIGKGYLQIKNCFNTANIFSYVRGYSGGAGGLIGKFGCANYSDSYDWVSQLRIDTCYSVGKLGKADKEANLGLGYLIGRLGSTGYGTDQTIQADITNCAYQPWDIQISIGSAWDPAGVTASLNQFRLRATDTQNDNTITYDENLKNQKYPYKIWTKKPDNQTEPYRGDWLN